MSEANVRVDRLRDYLKRQKTGQLQPGEVEGLLADCWDALLGSTTGGMTAAKISGRLEDVRWDPPRLSFVIERHGGTVLGSSRAALQEWVVDVDANVADYAETRHRRVRQNNPPLKVDPLVDQAFDLIAARQSHEWLTWRSNGYVAVRIGAIIPDDAPKETVAGRRKRFRTALNGRIEGAGGQVVRANVYAPPPRVP